MMTPPPAVDFAANLHLLADVAIAENKVEKAALDVVIASHRHSAATPSAKSLRERMVLEKVRRNINNRDFVKMAAAANTFSRARRQRRSEEEDDQEKGPKSRLSRPGAGGLAGGIQAADPGAGGAGRGRLRGEASDPEGADGERRGEEPTQADDAGAEDGGEVEGVPEGGRGVGADAEGGGQGGVHRRRAPRGPLPEAVRREPAAVGDEEGEGEEEQRLPRHHQEVEGDLHAPPAHRGFGRPSLELSGQ
ncbi:unnamed protein product [Cuscuta campestris]|uniref:Uncharacterized protein n=1 Tax=Cuscuta campestris TaxID=132261 RepID=A0A484K4I7_9ASTE|nr:unnamed protein product [Cuscuta campestris]